MIASTVMIAIKIKPMNILFACYFDKIQSLKREIGKIII